MHDEPGPAAWHPVVPADQLSPGVVVPVEVEGRELVIWSGAAGQVCVMDARCPHQWSHLGSEGVVDGDELVCASHFWRFDREGRGAKVNLAGRRDPKADVEVFDSRCRAGMIEVRLTSR